MTPLSWAPTRVAGWVDRFDAVMAAHLPWRDDAQRTALDLLQELGATDAVLDLGCGPGALCRELVDRWPSCRVTGLDRDPVMASLAAAHLRGRATVREQDLTAPGWGAVDAGAYSAAVASSVLHMVDAAGYALVAAEVAAAVGPGGVFIDIDEVAPEPGGRLAAACAALRERAVAERVGRGPEDHRGWLTALCAEPDLAAASRLRAARFAGRPDVVPATVEQRLGALAAAGFGEAAVVQRGLDAAVVVAIG